MKWFGHHETDNKPKLLSCKYCNTKFEDKEKLKRHVRDAHSEEGSAVFQNITENLNLFHHMRQIHHHHIIKCRECGKEFIHEKDRLHHVREQHEKEADYRKHKHP